MKLIPIGSGKYRFHGRYRKADLDFIFSTAEVVEMISLYKGRAKGSLDNIGEEGPVHLIDFLQKDFVPARVRAARYPAQERNWCNKLVAYMGANGPKYLHELTGAMITRMIDAAKKGAPPLKKPLHSSSLNHLRSTAIAALEYGKARGYLLQNVARATEKVEENQPRKRLMLPDEQARIFALAPLWLRDIMIVDLCLALRIHEVLKLTWTDIDFVGNRVRTKRGKGSDDEWIPMFGPLREIFERQVRNVNDPRVFRISQAKVSRTFKAIVLKALGKDADLRFHDLKRTAMTRLSMFAKNPLDVKALSGHKTIEMMSIYMVAERERIQEIGDRMCAEFFGEKAGDKVGDEKGMENE